MTWYTFSMPAKAGSRSRSIRATGHRVSFSFPTIMLMLVAVVVAPILVFASLAGATEAPEVRISSTLAYTAAESTEHVPIRRETFQNGIPECLRTCRDALRQCQEIRFSALRAEFEDNKTSATDALIVYRTDEGLASCGSSYQKCASACSPSAEPAVRCEVSCGVELDGCIQSSQDDEEALALCRGKNLACLDRCGGGGGNIEQIPPALCHAQCGIGLSACLAGSQYNVVLQDACRTRAEQCNTAVCDDTMLFRLGLLKPSETRASCAARCAEARNTCLAIAEGDAEGRGACSRARQECFVECQSAMPHFETVNSFPPSFAAEQAALNSSP